MCGPTGPAAPPASSRPPAAPFFSERAPFFDISGRLTRLGGKGESRPEPIKNTR
jgi:hypothetical protein